jgi:hypothetical protein
MTTQSAPKVRFVRPSLAVIDVLVQIIMTYTDEIGGVPTHASQWVKKDDTASFEEWKKARTASATLIGQKLIALIAWVNQHCLDNAMKAYPAYSYGYKSIEPIEAAKILDVFLESMWHAKTYDSAFLEQMIIVRDRLFRQIVRSTPAFEAANPFPENITVKVPIGKASEEEIKTEVPLVADAPAEKPKASRRRAQKGA